MCRHLLSEHHEVVAYDASPVYERVTDLTKQVTVVQGDVTDLAQLALTVKQHRVSHVVHLAAYLPEVAIRQNPTKAMRINGEGTNNVFEAALITGVERVVYASSDGVCPLGPAEDAAVQPRSLYGQLKYLNEVMGRHFADQFGLSTLGLRFVVNYGPGGRLVAGELARGFPSGRLFSVLEAVMRGESAESPDTGDEEALWMYVKDTARLIGLALNAKTSRRVINVTGTRTTLKKAIAIVQQMFPDAGQAVFATSGQAPLAQHWFDIDPAEARIELNYEARWTLNDGLLEYATSVRQSAAALA